MTGAAPQRALHSAGTFQWSGWRTKGAAREVASATVVLSLGIIGNAILPVPYAFSITGAVAGAAIFAATALANMYTCRLLLRGAVASATCDYEGLAEAVGGNKLRWAVEASTVLLLLGTNIGAVVQVGQSASSAVEAQWPGQASWWTANSGTWPMVIFTLGAVFPLSMLPTMRQLEVAGACGSIIVWVLTISIMAKSIANGLPQLGSSFPVVGFTSVLNVAEAFSLAGFGFYLQAMLMPMLGELQPGPAGAAAAVKAVDITVLGFALSTYILSGFFGAAMYGPDTSSNCLENEWLPGVGTFVLNMLVTLYLVISIPPIVHANTHTVRAWVDRVSGGRTARLPQWARRLVSTALVLGLCLGVACAVPGQSGTVLTFTGATFVCLVSFIFPVAFHFTSYFGRARFQREKAAAEAGLAAELASSGDAGVAKSPDVEPRELEAGAPERSPGVSGGCGTGSGVQLGPSPFDVAAPTAAGAPALQLAPLPIRQQAHGQLRGRSRLASAALALQAVPETGSLDQQLCADEAQLTAAPSLQQRGSGGGEPGMGRLALELLHAAVSAAPQRSQELEEELQARVDRQGLYRETLLASTLLPEARLSQRLSLSLGATPAASHRLSLAQLSLVRHSAAQGLPSAERDGLVLALLPPYRRSRVRHPALEAVVELGLPSLVLGMGLFFSVSTLVLLFN